MTGPSTGAVALRSRTSWRWSRRTGTTPARSTPILAIRRGEAWEYSEKVEENHISSAGHGVRPGWMTDEQAARFDRGRT